MPLSKFSRILLVDDSPAILALLRDLLRQQGYSNVRTATSVEDALAKFDEEEPEVVFLDLMMPEASGLAFTEKALEKNPKVRIVLTTALPPSHESVVMAISQGAAEYLQKPLRKDAVSTALDHLRREEGSWEEPYYR